MKRLFFIIIFFLSFCATNAQCREVAYASDLRKSEDLRNITRDSPLGQDAWYILYETNKLELTTNKKALEDLIDRIKSSGKSTEDFLDDIIAHGGYDAWKNFTNGVDDLADILKPLKGKYADDVLDALKKDFPNATDLKKIVDDGLIESWKSLENFTDLRRDHLVLESYSKVIRIGNYTDNVKPTKVSELTRGHGAPKLGQEGDILLHHNTFSTTGYDLSKPIPAIELPDGTLLMADGHHRLKALESLEQIVVPVKKVKIDDAFSELNLTDFDVAVLVEVSKLSGNYKGTFKVDVIDNFGVKLEAKSFMDNFFPGWR